MQKHVNFVDLVKSFPTTGNEYFVAKFGFDTADNKPDKIPPRDLIFTYIPRPRSQRDSSLRRIPGLQPKSRLRRKFRRQRREKPSLGRLLLLALVAPRQSVEVASPRRKRRSDENLPDAQQFIFTYAIDLPMLLFLFCQCNFPFLGHSAC